MEPLVTQPGSDLDAIMAHSSEHCVSIFLPTHRSGSGTAQDPIRLKNLIRTADDRLEERGVRQDDRKALLAPARARLEDTDFWQHQADGLAFFLAPEVTHEMRLPIAFEELVVVGRWFEVKPLLPLLASDGQFYVLALSQGSNHLLRATRHAVSRVDVPDAPASLEDALRFDDPERQLQFHSGTASPPGQGTRRAAMYHGQGGGADERTTDMLRYCQQVEAGVTRVLAGGTAPLVIVALETLQATYREANSYPHLLEQGVSHNPDDLDDDALHDLTSKVVEPVLRQSLDAARERFRAAHGTSGAADGLADVLPMAWQGRVATVFLAKGEHQRGRYDPEGETLILASADDQPADDARDLLDLVARRTLLHGGTVHLLPQDEMPSPAPVSAVLRF